MSDIQHRKQSHIEICTHRDVGFRQSTLLEEVTLIHCALPELNLSDVSLETAVAGIKVAAPFMIGAMTGGTGTGARFNMALAELAGQFNVALCLGSIRPALVNPEMVAEFDVKSCSRGAPVFSNIGANQLEEFGPERILKLAGRISDGLFVHLNAGMELIQPRGDTRFSGQVAAIAKLVAAAGSFPVVVKETGMGLSLRDGLALREAGVCSVETAGAGGTSWIGVETERASGIDRAVGKMLWDFGIPTAASIGWMKQLGMDVVGSGGIYTALDAARAIRLGANAVAMARPWLQTYHADGLSGLVEKMNELMVGLKYLMVCVGKKSIAELQRADCIIGERLQKYLNFTPGDHK